MSVIGLDKDSKQCKELATQLCGGCLSFDGDIFCDDVRSALLELHCKKVIFKHKSTLEYVFVAQVGVQPIHSQNKMAIVFVNLVSCYINVSQGKLEDTSVYDVIKVTTWRDCNIYNDDYDMWYGQLKLAREMSDRAKEATSQLSELRKQLDHALMMTPEFNLGAQGALATKTNINMQLTQLQSILTQAAEIRGKAVSEFVNNKIQDGPSKLTVYGLALQGNECNLSVTT